MQVSVKSRMVHERDEAAVTPGIPIRGVAGQIEDQFDDPATGEDLAEIHVAGATDHALPLRLVRSSISCLRTISQFPPD